MISSVFRLNRHISKHAFKWKMPIGASRTITGPALVDTYARQHSYLRISLTEKCNLRCVYCMPQNGIDLTPTSQLLTTDEILKLVSVFRSEGVTKIRLTGGEPTLRRDLLDIVSGIQATQDAFPKYPLKTIAMTTNGLALSTGDRFQKLVDAGLNAVNVSLDTLDPLKFPLMTRRPGHEKVIRSLEMCLEAGIKTKLNCVLIRGLNDGEVDDFVKLTENKDLEVRFIEYMPFDDNQWNASKMIPYFELKHRIEERFGKLERGIDEEDRVAKTYYVPGHRGRVAFISSMTDQFCSTCNRIRITADGNFKVCLFGTHEVSLRDIMRCEPDAMNLARSLIAGLPENTKHSIMHQEGLPNTSLSLPDELSSLTPDDILKLVICAAIRKKKPAHAGMEILKMTKNRPMIKIGG